MASESRRRSDSPSFIRPSSYGFTRFSQAVDLSLSEPLMTAMNPASSTAGERSVAGVAVAQHAALPVRLELAVGKDDTFRVGVCLELRKTRRIHRADDVR